MAEDHFPESAVSRGRRGLCIVARCPNRATGPDYCDEHGPEDIYRATHQPPVDEANPPEGFRQGQ